MAHLASCTMSTGFIFREWSKSYISRYQNEKIHATRRNVGSDISVKENFCLILDTHLIHYSFIWNR